MTRSKYNNKKVLVDGHVFDSKKEGRRYQELVLLLRAGEIVDLELQPKFRIDVNSKHICNYLADFRYVDVLSGERKVEDVKGIRTQVYQLKRKLVEALYGITISEV